jgi:hypothetical protein
LSARQAELSAKKKRTEENSASLQENFVAEMDRLEAKESSGVMGLFVLADLSVE